jgi:hypothetical protein
MSVLIRYVGPLLAGALRRPESQLASNNKKLATACELLDKRVVDVTRTRLRTLHWYEQEGKEYEGAMSRGRQYLTVRVSLVTADKIYQSLAMIEKEERVGPCLNDLCNESNGHEGVPASHGRHTYTCLSPVLPGPERHLLLLQMVSGRCRPGCSLRYKGCLSLSAEEANARHTFAQGIANYCEYANDIQVLHVIAHPYYCNLRPLNPSSCGHPYMSPILSSDAFSKCTVTYAMIHPPVYEGSVLVPHETFQVVLTKDQFLHDLTVSAITKYLLYSPGASTGDDRRRRVSLQ